MRCLKLLLAAVGASVLLGALASTAFAGRLSSTSSTYRVTYERMNFRGVWGTVECPLTLEGSLHSATFRKVAGTLIGYITSAAVGATCRRLSGTILRETLPWHVRYAGFSGTLPNITRIHTDVVGFSYRITEAMGIRCLMTSEAGEPIAFDFNRDTTTGVLTGVLSSGVSIETTCGVPGELNGFSTATTLLNNAARITLTLI